MGITLWDRETDEPAFDINFWHYRAIVEAIRDLGVLPDETVDGLHEQFLQTGLTREEARTVARAIRERLLPTLHPEERLLLDGSRTDEPDDGTLHRTLETQHLNYSTNREVLERFAVCCETCAGFFVT